jgi:uridine kinase
MIKNPILDPDPFCAALHEKMKQIAPVVEMIEPYEFRYLLNNLAPDSEDWHSVKLLPKSEIESQISSLEFLKTIDIKPKVDGKIVLDPFIRTYTQILFTGLVTGIYDSNWINKYFYFDPRGFIFLVRSVYLTDEIISHLGGMPFKQFEKKQKTFEWSHEVGYQDFMKANAEVDGFFIESILKLVAKKGYPVLLAIAGPTAAGKTEIVERISEAFTKLGKKMASIELDNYLTDRDQREEKGIGSFGKAALHFDLFRSDIRTITEGKKIATPRYDFIDGTSSHDLEGKLKPGRKPVNVEPADIIIIEGNSPFLLPEIAPLITIKVVYLTDDPIRLKRKWRRDIDYRKKYDLYYFLNRFFSEQPSMAKKNYRPQLITCDIFVDTTGAAVWVTPEIAKILCS